MVSGASVMSATSSSALASPIAARTADQVRLVMTDGQRRAVLVLSIAGIPLAWILVGPWAGLLAGLIVGTYPPLIGATGDQLSEPLGAFLLIAAFTVLAVALFAIGMFASIYHPVGIPMIVQGSDRPGFVIGVNGLVGNLGIAIGASLSVLLATRYGWQMAYIVPGVVCLIAAVLFATLVPKEQEAPAKRKAKMLDLPPNVMARVFFIMTCAAVTGSIVFNFTTNSNGEMLKARLAELAANPWLLSMVLLGVFTVASLAQIAVGWLIDRFPLKTIYLPILLAQIPLFVLAAYAEGWALIAVTTLFMVFVFGAIPFTDAMIVRYVDDRMRSRVTGMRLAIGFGVSSLVVAAIGPSVKAAGFPSLLMALAFVAACTVLAISFLPNERQAAAAALEPAE